MQLEGNLGHLSYCSNIHPGENWQNHFDQLRRALPAIKHALAPNQPFGIGLRLSAIAAEALSTPDKLNEFRRWLKDNDFYVFTINGFPYGEFHGKPVKENVYQPSWLQEERWSYTSTLLDILSALLPQGEPGSISTVPLGYAKEIMGAAERDGVCSNLLKYAAKAWKIEEEGGPCIQLALEPEPGCALETTDDVLNFYHQHLFSEQSVNHLRRLMELPDNDANRSECKRKIAKYLGVCLDTCHSAVMFESASESAKKILNAGISIAKIQLTAALKADNMNLEKVSLFESFADPIYLHQTTCKDENNLRFFMDLPEACRHFRSELSSPSSNQEWRTHFHVPVFLQSLGLLQTTSEDLSKLLDQHKQHPISHHLEVETYTFDVLPEHYQAKTIEQNIVREIDWVRERLR